MFLIDGKPPYLLSEKGCEIVPDDVGVWFEGYHLNRDEVAQLIAHLQHWYDTGSLDLDKT